ncbi:dTDP-4-dehydrorhamnose 3,5-epimerase [Coxiella burnetii]|uniref:dTDP-4-dehydrorhamnose 3,5-epimerase n=1 Tax=Coxiella burnetii TaxID=777 RepID=UPI000163A1C0|nr:dTDP-4-dehydrorhamnose 3,5-epimerase [Coxiella burnetii]AIT62483.1 dTDP-4-dehydrorhamnose 3,5-epimerase [Coxiella burnetii str. Namibia]ATN85102.1 dTDP-4-dehydrorhamnose 3,5-epimerase [Coxiella burnetii str. Schperling]EDR36686.1 dTDP-4-dehydrorhamnose 3,5-epimerase [Coxiella burnetii Q321]PHH58016.1 dTDP-4-dehydrorhamnose 3,5-epimerase [Coxiella burnetii]
MPFEFQKMPIPEVILIKPKVFTDDRGFFIETFKQSDFRRHGINGEFLQDNHSLSMKKGVLRGLHYQLDPHAQGKLVRVVLGKVFDVAVDLRRESPTFGKWVSTELSSTNNHMLWIPPGFAHGMLVLEENTHLLYKCTAEYVPASERYIRWDDPDINIKWPIKNNLLLSEKDAAGVFLQRAEINAQYHGS